MKIPGMKFVILLSALTALCGCVYEVPLVEEALLPIDPAAVGVWTTVRDEAEGAAQAEKLVVLPFSGNEYMIIYPAGKDEMYFRAYPVEVSGMKLIQLRWIGQRQSPLGGKEKPYQLCSYDITDDLLTIRVLNAELLDREAETPEKLQRSLFENKSAPGLLQEPGRFRKVVE
jgi:hypothetical protein